MRASLKSVYCLTNVLKTSWRCYSESEAGLWSRSPSDFGWLKPEPKQFRWWSRSVKFGFPFNRNGLWSKRVLQIIQWFLVFIDQIFLETEPEPKNLDAWSWSRSLKFTFRLHSPGQGRPTSQRLRATFLTVLLQWATSYTWAHMNITHLSSLTDILLLRSFIVMHVTNGVYCN